MNRFCSNCGKELDANSNFCPECGNQVNGIVTPITTVSDKTNSLAIAGFVTALISLFLNFWGIVGIVATVLSAVAIPQTGERKEKGRGIAVAGLIVGIFSIIYGLSQIMSVLYI